MPAEYASALSAGSGSQPEVDLEYLQAPPVPKDQLLKEFTLTERSGKKVGSRDLAGQVYVTSFFFSSCPSTCLQQNQKIHEIEQEYAAKGVKFVSITCDPEVDTPDRLREYAAKLGAGKGWLFLTGDLTYIRRIAGEIFQVQLDKGVHSEKLLVTDKWGNNRRSHFAWNQLDQVTALKLELDKLLAEKEPPAPDARRRADAGGISQLSRRVHCPRSFHSCRMSTLRSTRWRRCCWYWGSGKSSSAARLPTSGRCWPASASPPFSWPAI